MGIPAQAGMYCINHWIPAFAGMTGEGEDLGYKVNGGNRLPRW